MLPSHRIYKTIWDVINEKQPWGHAAARMAPDQWEFYKEVMGKVDYLAQQMQFTGTLKAFAPELSFVQEPGVVDFICEEAGHHIDQVFEKWKNEKTSEDKADGWRKAWVYNNPNAYAKDGLKSLLLQTSYAIAHYYESTEPLISDIISEPLLHIVTKRKDTEIEESKMLDRDVFSRIVQYRVPLHTEFRQISNNSGDSLERISEECGWKGRMLVAAWKGYYEPEIMGRDAETYGWASFFKAAAGLDSSCPVPVEVQKFLDAVPDDYAYVLPVSISHNIPGL